MESRRPWCFDCTLKPKIEDKLAYCPNPIQRPSNCPLDKEPQATSRVMTWIVTGVLCVALGIGGYSLGRTEKSAVVPVITPEDTAIQLASQVTVLFPSALTYVQQAALEAGTGLSGVDFIYCERQTGIDALTLMAIAAHESAWGTNNWSKRYNNVMSWGISDSNPDREVYETKTQNVLAAAQGLKRLYLSESATYYGGSLTLYGVNKYYASDKGWAAGVLSICKQLEAKLTETQRMQRWCNKVGLFDIPTTWDTETKRLGWTWYKMNNATVGAGR